MSARDDVKGGAAAPSSSSGMGGLPTKASPEHRNIDSWRGAVDTKFEYISHQIDQLFRKHDESDEKIDQLKDKVTAISAKAGVYAALGSAIATMVASGLIAVLLKIFMK